MILIRSLVFNVAFYLSFIFLMTIGLPTMIISRGSVLVVVRLWARVSLWLLATICGVTLGVLSARKPGGLIDRVGLGVAYLGKGEERGCDEATPSTHEAFVGNGAREHVA